MSSVQAFGIGAAQALTDAANIEVRLGRNPGYVPPGTTNQVGMGNSFKVTIAGNRNLDIYDPVDGQIIYFWVTQDGSGSRTLTPRLNGVASTVLTSGTPLTVTAGALDLVAVQYREDLGKLVYYPIAKNIA